MHFYGKCCRKFKICKSSAGNTAGNAVGNLVGNAAANAVGNLVGNDWGNDTVFSLNTWLTMIYCLQTIHEPACVILTLFQFFVAFPFLLIVVFQCLSFNVMRIVCNAYAMSGEFNDSSSQKDKRLECFVS